MRKKIASKRKAKKSNLKKRKIAAAKSSQRMKAKKSLGTKHKQFLKATSLGIRIKIQDFLKSVEGAQPGDLRILAYRILERAQKVSEGLKKKK